MPTQLLHNLFIISIMKQIKNITVAVDFSAPALNAYRYAQGLAEMLNATLTVVAVKEVFKNTSVSIQDDETLNRDIKELITEKDLATDTLMVKSEVNTKILKGDPVDVLTELSAGIDTDLIVMGTTGSKDLLTKVIGSVSKKVANKAHCPVILVPRGAKWTPIEQIMYASNYDSISPGVIHEIADFAIKIKADVHFVNVKNYDPVFEIKQNEVSWVNLFDSVDSDLYFETETIYGNNTVDELKKYCEEKSINMMAFVSKHRNFWETIIHQSITENMALSTTIPIMVIHLDDK